MHKDFRDLYECYEVIRSSNFLVRRAFNATGVAAILDAEKISYTVLEDGESTVEREVTVAGHGKKHALIYPGWKEVVNTGYFIANKFFYPGDAFLDPKIPVEVLALPVAGPWMKISEAIDYALIIKPKIAFPVHDGMLKPIAKTHHLVPGKILAEHEIEFRAMNAGDRTSF